MVSERTKKLKKSKIVCFILSLLTWVGTAAVYVCCAISKGLGASEMDSGLGTYLLSMATTLIVAIVLTLVIKDKVRVTIWMSSVILSSIIFGDTGMYITFGLWALDEFVLYALYKMFKRKLEINKEIDLRN